VVWGLIDLQRQTTKDPKCISTLHDCQNRVYAMALIHDSLCMSPDLSCIDFTRFLRSLSAKLLEVYRITGNRVTISITGETLFLDNYTAIPCGLIINELISNVLKHAFPDGRPGGITIDFQLEDLMYTLSFRDDGIGIPRDLDITTTGSLGLKLVNLLVTEQLEGTIRLDRTDGTAFMIRFPKKETAPFIHPGEDPGSP
jgi:two-component sensor histidine kinase